MKCNREYFKRGGLSCVAARILVAKERKNTFHADVRRLKGADERRGFYSYNPKK